MAKQPKRDRDRVCGNCFHWTPDEPGGTAGYCRKNPPTVLYDTEEGVFTSLPHQPADEWCGEHKASQ